MSDCTFQEASAGLLAAVHADDSWRTGTSYAGAKHVDSRACRCASAAFEAYVCSLSVRKPKNRVLAPDWAFGAEAPTLGKCLARWCMHLYLGIADDPPRRYVLDEDELDDWKWLPKAGCSADRRTRKSWVTYDVCEARAGRRAPLAAELGRALLTSRGGVALLSHLRGNDSATWTGKGDPLWMATDRGGQTSAGAWVASQMVRMVRRSLGPCSLAAVQELKVRTAALPPTESSTRLRSPTADTLVPIPPRTLAAARPPFAIAVQVRRGDACERWVAGAAAGGERMAATVRRRVDAVARPCFHTEDYFTAARAVLRHLQQSRSAGRAHRGAPYPAGAGVARRAALLLVASDSPHLVGEMHQLMRQAPASDGWQGLLAVDGPRGAAWGAAEEGANLGKRREDAMLSFIERRNEAGLVNRTAVLASLLADLALVSGGQGFVGTAASWTSRLALLALAGERGSIPPFELLDQPVGKLWFA